jgi:hypothetical protein
MLWSLLSSAFVIYLYRKLDAERQPQPSEDEAADLNAALDTLSVRLGALEQRLASEGSRETGR